MLSHTQYASHRITGAATYDIRLRRQQSHIQWSLSANFNNTKSKSPSSNLCKDKSHVSLNRFDRDNNEYDMDTELIRNFIARNFYQQTCKLMI